MSHKKAINEKVRGRGPASVFAGGPVSESGCGGPSASTEPDEGCSSFAMRLLPPLDGVLRGDDATGPCKPSFGKSGVQVPLGGRRAPH